MDDIGEDTIELGTVSEETKGIPAGTNDSLGGHRGSGLSDD